MSMHVTSNCVSKIVLTAPGKKRTTYRSKDVLKMISERQQMRNCLFSYEGKRGRVFIHVIIIANYYVVSVY